MFKGWDLNSVRDIKAYVNWMEYVGHTPGDPQSVSLNA